MEVKIGNSIANDLQSEVAGSGMEKEILQDAAKEDPPPLKSSEVTTTSEGILDKKDLGLDKSKVNHEEENILPLPESESKGDGNGSREASTSPTGDEMSSLSKDTETSDSIVRNNSSNSFSPTNSSLDSCQATDAILLGNEVKKTKRKSSKKKRKPDELLQCIICGRTGLTSEFCASGRFCSQRCVGAYASKCRADTLAAASAGGEVLEPKKRKRHRKDGGKKGTKGLKRKSYLFEKDFHDITSPMLSPMGHEDIKNKKAKLSLTDDAYFFYSAVGKEKPFEWELYLSIIGKQAVPVEVFQEENPDFEAIPAPASDFKPGMKLEAVDPRHPSCICVVSVVETQGARLRLHFDGWSESYDFWTNSDSHLLFPVGFCARNGQKLNIPRGYQGGEFKWEAYLDETGSEAAPEYLFRKIPHSTHGFTTNMKLEAVDKKNPDLTCVASVTNVVGDYFLVHFDEWDDTYDYWCRETCPYLHPVGWCKEIGIRLTPPQDDQVDTFDWNEYLKQTNSIAVPAQLLKKRAATNFKVGQKLEVVDPRNPSLVRVGTVSFIEEFQLKIHFDGWDNMYDYWFDSASNDLHPVKWCERTGHPLESPPSFLDAQDTTLCPTPGCRGIGHVKGAKYTTHHSIFGCPYSPTNVTRGSPLVDRLANNSMGEEPSISSRVYNCRAPKNGEDTLPDSTTKADLIKQQKLLKGIVGRPAKKPLEKSSPKATKFFTRNLNKLAIKEKPRVNKKGLFGQQEGNGQSSSPENLVSSTSATSKHQTKTSMPIIKVMNKTQNKLKFESSQIKTWTVRDVAQFIRSIGLVEHATNFEEQQIDGEALLLLSQSDMIHHLKIKLGPALKISNAITKAA